jgi:GDP-L-fucose synthase
MTSYTRKKILVLGSTGMVGSALVRKLEEAGYNNLLTPTRGDLNLLDQIEVTEYFTRNKPHTVLNAAAKVGGIKANNTYRGEFIYDNLQIQSSVIHAARVTNVSKMIFLGSSCIYPRMAPQPIREEDLLSGPLEYTNEPYAIAKIAGIKMCESFYRQWGCNYIALMPCNQYGPNDNYDLETSHVLPALMRKFHEATTNNKKYVTLWGTGQALREFQYVDDLADACIYAMSNVNADDIYDNNISHLNVGTGEEIRIGELADKLAMLTDFRGKIKYELGTSDGTPRKVMDSSRLNAFGWKSKIGLDKGLQLTYNWFKEHYAEQYNTPSK